MKRCRGNVMKIRRKYIVLIFFSSLLGIFWGSYINSCIASPQGTPVLTPRDRAFAVHFLDEKKGWIVGDMGLCLETSDGGKSWQRVKIGLGTVFNDITFVGTYGWIVGPDGLILHTTNGGKQWSKQESNSNAVLMTVFFLDQSKGFIVGSEGTILRTDNGGSSWHSVAIDWIDLMPEVLLEMAVTVLNLYDIIFIDKYRGWIVGDFGSVLYTSDGGRQWSLLQCSLLPHLFSVYFKDGQDGWAVGQNGFFLETKDGGTNWKKRKVLGAGENLYKIRMVGEKGAIVGDHGAVFQTDNVGKTWVRAKLKRIKMMKILPWFADASIIKSKSSVKCIFVGKGIIDEITIPDKGQPKK